jgi:hypothetical protein
VRAKVSGFDRTSKYWQFSYPTMPPFMAFAIDADKECYYHLFPEYRCYDIHDALDIPHPLVTTVNPISDDCRFIYMMRWRWMTSVDSKPMRRICTLDMTTCDGCDKRNR